MHMPPHDAKLDLVIDFMRALSRQTDPQEAAALYSRGLMKLNLVPNDRYLSLSRRGLSPPQFRITRNSSWTYHPNPWKEPHKLPLLSGGILGEIVYSNNAAIITDLPAVLKPDDPAYDTLRDMKLLVAFPHFDQGESVNVGVLLNKTAEGFPFKDVPMMVWQANLWGRATLNLVNRQKLEEANRAMDNELRVVAEIQHSLLPRKLPDIPGVQVAAHYQTSQRAGGDYYDFFPLPADQWGILIADVSGHGTPAAVLMAITHAIAHARPGHPIPPEDLLSFVNAHLARLYTNDNGSFVTAIYAILDSRKMTLTCANAGHPPPRLIRSSGSDGEIICLAGDSSLPLGVHHHETFSAHTFQLQPGDRIIFYTDGIVEAFDPDGNAFGTERLDAASRSELFNNPNALLDNLLARLGDFTHGTAATDDRTLLVLQIS